MCGRYAQVKRRLPKVNKEMAARLLLDQDGAAPAAGSSEEDAPEKPPAQKKHKGLPNLLQDDRFAALFKDKVGSTPRPSGAARLWLCTPALSPSSIQRRPDCLLFTLVYCPIAAVVRRSAIDGVISVTYEPSERLISRKHPTCDISPRPFRSSRGYLLQWQLVQVGQASRLLEMWPVVDQVCLIASRLQEFAIDPGSDEYKALHPNAPERHAKERALLEEHFEDVDSEEEGDEDDQEQAGPSDSDLDSGSDRGKRKREPKGPAKKQARKKEGPR
jgi:hypothetical protein